MPPEPHGRTGRLGRRGGDEPDAGVRTDRTRSRRLAATALNIVALSGCAWVAWIFARSAISTADLLPRASGSLAGATAALALHFVLSAAMFALLVRAGGSSGMSVPRTLELFFVGQLLKYLPGRVWGILYQAAKADRPADRGAIVRANLDFMIIGILVNAGTCTVLVGARLSWPTWVTIGVPAGCTALFLIRYARTWYAPILRALDRISPRIGGLYLHHLHAGHARRTLYSAVGIQLIGLASIVLAWHLLVRSLPELGDVPVLDLCLLYLLSSIVGMLSIVTPAGLGVREASFLGLGLTIAPSDTVAALAITVRVWMLLAECAVAALAVALLRLSTIRARFPDDRTATVPEPR